MMYHIHASIPDDWRQKTYIKLTRKEKKMKKQNASRKITQLVAFKTAKRLTFIK